MSCVRLCEFLLIAPSVFSNVYCIFDHNILHRINTLSIKFKIRTQHSLQQHCSLTGTIYIGGSVYYCSLTGTIYIGGSVYHSNVENTYMTASFHL
jgi:hypothetical protein